MEFSSSTTHVQTFSQTTKIVGGKWNGEEGSAGGSLASSTSSPWVASVFVPAGPLESPRHQEPFSPILLICALIKLQLARCSPIDQLSRKTA